MSSLIARGRPRAAVRWHCSWRVEKYAALDAGTRADAPDQVVEGEGNLLMTNGANALWTALTGGSVTAFSSANARIGVGDSSAAESAGQTDLQAAANKFRKGMDPGYPQVATNQATFRATLGSGEANFAWNEWAIFNAGTGGTMLNRKVAASGTKASGSTWVITVTLSLS